MKKDEVNCPRCGGTAVSLLSEIKSEFKCKDCRARFGDEEKALDYESKMVRFILYIKDFCRAGLTLKIYKEDDRIKYSIKLGSERRGEGELSLAFWKTFSHRLFSEWNFHNWYGSYFGTSINDGTLWDIEVGFERKHTLSVHGYNSYPYYWNNLISELIPILFPLKKELSSFSFFRLINNQ